MIVKFQVVPESGHQSFMIVAQMDDGRLLMCGNDWVWYDITPSQGDSEDERE